jgi:acyl dehydratase
VVREVVPSRSKPDRGIIRTTYEMFNQNGERVLSIKGIGMFARRSREGGAD